VVAAFLRASAPPRENNLLCGGGLWEPAVARGLLPESMRRRVPSIASR
jgi:hypothetical protein